MAKKKFGEPLKGKNQAWRGVGNQAVVVEEKGAG